MPKYIQVNNNNNNKKSFFLINDNYVVKISNF